MKILFAYIRMPTQMPYYVPNKFIGGLINKFLPKLSKAFRKFLERVKDEPLESIVIYRSPLDKVSTTFLQFLTAGNWEEIKRRGGIDKLFHTYAIINDKYLYEKTAVPQFKMASSADKSRANAEEMSIAVKNITIGQFIENAIKKMGDNYHTYDGFGNNCQDFLVGSLKGSGMSDGGFLKQDIARLVEETPSFSKWLGKEITDLAGAGEKAYSEVADKRGGRRRFGY